MRQLSQRTGGALEDSLLIAMTELLCCWEKRQGAVEDSCERGAVFQVQSLYESFCWRGCPSTQYPNALQPYLSQPIDTISVSSRSWSCFSRHTLSPTGFKPSKISLCIHSVQACCSLAHHTVSFTTASMLPTLWHVLTDHATQNAHGLLLLMHL